MPRIALVVLGVLGGCSFEADYAGGVYACNDLKSKCPPGHECRPNLDNELVCREVRMDAAIDSLTGDGGDVDAAVNKLNCMEPHPLVNGVSFTDSTEPRSDKLTTSCFSKSMYGRDAVHVITPGAGNQMAVEIQSAAALTAYVLSACPQTACNGNVYATPTKPITVYTLAGPHYIIVDSLAADVSGAYTLKVSY